MWESRRQKYRKTFILPASPSMDHYCRWALISTFVAMLSPFSFALGSTIVANQASVIMEWDWSCDGLHVMCSQRRLPQHGYRSNCYSSKLGRTEIRSMKCGERRNPSSRPGHAVVDMTGLVEVVCQRNQSRMHLVSFRCSRMSVRRFLCPEGAL
jgi:hypothetical protein